MERIFNTLYRKINSKLDTITSTFLIGMVFPTLITFSEWLIFMYILNLNHEIYTKTIKYSVITVSFCEIVFIFLYLFSKNKNKVIRKFYFIDKILNTRRSLYISGHYFNYYIFLINKIYKYFFLIKVAFNILFFTFFVILEYYILGLNINYVYFLIVIIGVPLIFFNITSSYLITDYLLAIKYHEILPFILSSKYVRTNIKGEYTFRNQRILLGSFLGLIFITTFLFVFLYLSGRLKCDFFNCWDYFRTVVIINIINFSIVIYFILLKLKGMKNSIFLIFKTLEEDNIEYMKYADFKTIDVSVLKLYFTAYNSISKAISYKNRLNYLLNNITKRLKEENKKAKILTKTLQLYLPKIIMDLSKNTEIDDFRTDFLEIPEVKKLSGFIFVDIMGFTSLTMYKSPNEVIKFLNYIFQPIIDFVIAKGGDIQNFMGDEIFITHDDPEETLRVALKIANEYSKMLGVGFHVSAGYGEFIMGNVGSEKRRAYTIVSKDVNIVHKINKEAGKNEVVAQATLIKNVDLNYFKSYYHIEGPYFTVLPFYTMENFLTSQEEYFYKIKPKKMYRGW